MSFSSKVLSPGRVIPMLGSGTKVAQAVLRAELRHKPHPAPAFRHFKTLLYWLSNLRKEPGAFDSIASGPPSYTSEAFSNPQPSKPIHKPPSSLREGCPPSLSPPSLRDRSNIRAYHNGLTATPTGRLNSTSRDRSTVERLIELPVFQRHIISDSGFQFRGQVRYHFLSDLSLLFYFGAD